MSTSTNTSPIEIEMGYGGYCFIDWKNTSLLDQSKTSIEGKIVLNTTTNNKVFITGGNIAVSYSRPSENTYKAPRNTDAASPLLFGPGTASISGSVSFDMSHTNLEYFLDADKLSRNTFFHLELNDGNYTYMIPHNAWNSFSISASTGGVLTCSIGYMSLNKFSTEITPTSPSDKKISDYFSNALVAYWQAGTDGYIDSFTINLNQDITPVYLNNDKIMPSYLRSGSLKLTANIQSSISWQNISSLLDLANSKTNTKGEFTFNIGSKKFIFNNALLSSQQYNHAGAGDVAKYSYSIQSMALKSPSQDLFTIA